MPEQSKIAKALAMLPNPVAVLIVKDQDETNGMIASWITQVSSDPPRILVAVHPSRYTHAMIHSAGFFTLNLLAQGQEDRVPQLKLKGGKREEKFAGLEVAQGPNDQPYLPDSAAVFFCKLADVLEAGDHTLFVAEVTAAQSNDAAPLSTTTLGKAYSGRE